MKIKLTLITILLAICSISFASRPCTSATLSFSQSISGSTATLTAVHTGLASPSYRWTYNTATIGTGSTTTHSISSSGSNLVCLEITQLLYDSSGFVIDSCTMLYCDTVGSSSSSGCPSLRANAYNSDTLCLPNGINTATLGGSPTATGGTPGYTYNWTGNPLDVTFNNSNIANPIASVWGTYATVFLTVTDSMGCVARDTLVLDTNCIRTLSITEQNKLLGISVFPNPANDLLSLKFEDGNKGNNTIIIKDISGKLIKNEVLKTGQTSINVSLLSSGTYILFVENSKNQLYKPIRFIKN